MAEAKPIWERIIELPLSKLEHMNGFALDFGGQHCRFFLRNSKHLGLTDCQTVPIDCSN